MPDATRILDAMSALVESAAMFVAPEPRPPKPAKRGACNF